ncbi:nucleolar MIF4G domain-containing protein 1 [Pyxicephalus adspersus]|uniref:nucleolar MIF4G domain-containing protein 1 n=1 Tax=Pyxicephalus adspersus TaxID=30357 RepID=UPI003B5AA34B
MKRKAPNRVGTEKIRKLQRSVQTFVEKAEGGGSQSNNRLSGGYSGTGSKVKSRKELRKEQRLSKKLRKKEYYQRKYLGNQQSAEPAQDAQHKAPQTSPAKKPEAGGQGRDRPAGKEPRGKKPGPQPRHKKESKEEVRKKALLEANEKEEREIRKLERSLKMNRRKNKSSLPQAFTQDGLDYILGVLEPGSSVAGLYDDEEEEENTTQKIQKLSENPFQGDTEGESGGSEDEDEDDHHNEEDDSDEDNNMEEQSEEDEAMEQESEVEDDVEGDDNEGDEDEADDDDGDQDDQAEETSQHGSDSGDEEEPAIADKNSKNVGNKYVPPQLRQSSEAVDAKRREELERLKKSVKGLMNRLSEPNMSSISGQLEELYMTNSRKDMNDTVTTVLCNACITPSKLPDRLMMEHVLLISILHHTVGIEVGAHILESVVKQFYDLHQNIGESKECDNLLTFIGHLYNFHVIDSRLVFDILKLLVAKFTERNIELILLLLKNVGFSLRKDDALSLKELISEAQNKANAVDKEFQDHTRVRFMLETMLALKNNDMRKIPGYDPEPVEKLRKLQRSLVHNSVSGSDTRLRVSLENLLEAEKVGRWWIVGSSWSGAPMINESSGKVPAQSIGKVSAKIMDLARKQRMNTDIRRNIFCVIMTSEDYLDAFEKLIKLGLKDHQEREIVHVLLDCCLQEKIYNPFYAFLASKF